MTLALLRFESFTLDLERLTLNGPSGPANLRRKSFDVLRYLAERAGRVVTKEELIKAVWPDVTVGDESLTKCISEVRQAIGDEGQLVIKTVPRRGYLFDATIAPTDIPAIGTAGAKSPVVPERPSIAVLPFANMSGDPQQEYISDGIVEDIITELSRFSGLFVIARNSSFQWKGKMIDARQVGRELGVRYLLEGSVRRAGERIRISAQLINAESGNHLWAERYDRDVQDVFALQDEVARRVAAILAAHVTKAEAERTVLKPPKSWQAYDHYMRAAEIHATFHRAMQVTALYETRELLNRCLAMEPAFARAHVLYSATLVTTWTLALDGDHRNPPVLEKPFAGPRRRCSSIQISRKRTRNWATRSATWESRTRRSPNLSERLRSIRISPTGDLPPFSIGQGRLTGPSKPRPRTCAPIPSRCRSRARIWGSAI